MKEMAEDTKNIREWMEKLLQTKLEPQDDLRRALENGTQLCKLIQKIKPGLITDFNENPTLKYKMTENV